VADEMQVDFHLLIQSVPITTKAVRSIPNRGGGVRDITLRNRAWFGFTHTFQVWWLC
jgi:hypothetical protein